MMGHPYARQPAPKQKASAKRRLTAAAAAAMAIAVPAEGIYLYAYKDPVGIPTACMGATIGLDMRKVRMGQTYTMEQCRQLLDRDMLSAIEAVESCRPGLSVPVLAAFADAVYNMGPTIACDQSRSTAARLLASGNIEGACKQLPRWNKARVAGVMVELPGLTKRRNEEMALCLEGV